MERGALVRAELHLDRRGIDAVHPALVEAIVDGVRRDVANDPRLNATGVAVEGGCAISRCTVAVEGLRSTADAAIAALGSALTGSAPAFSMIERRQIRRAWRERPEYDDVVLRAALVRTFSPESSVEYRHLVGAQVPPPRPLDRAIASAWASFLSAVPAPEITTSSRAIPTGEVLIGPRRARTWVAVVWESSGLGADLLRDAVVVGDFESVAVQTLREGSDPLTYDVLAEHGTGWTAAVFQTQTDDATRAADMLGRALTDTQNLDEIRLHSAYLRLLSRHDSARDSLAGQLALLPQMPPPPTGPLPKTKVIGYVYFGLGPSTGGTSVWSREAMLTGQSASR